MKILDWVMDQIVTAWELLGLMFLSGSADPGVLRRWERELEEADADTEPESYPAGPGREAHQAHCA